MKSSHWKSYPWFLVGPQQSVDREGRSDMGEVGRRQKGGSPIVILYKPTSEKKTKKHPQKAESQKPSFIFTSLALLQFSFFHEKCHCQSLENLVKHVNQVKYVKQVSQVHLLLHLLIQHHLYHHLHDHNLHDCCKCYSCSVETFLDFVRWKKGLTGSFVAEKHLGGSSRPLV